VIAILTPLIPKRQTVERDSASSNTQKETGGWNARFEKQTAAALDPVTR
jgi:hypothetical protein